MSSQGCTPSPMTIEKLNSLEEYNSSTEQQRQPKRSKTLETGSRPSKCTPRLSHSCSLIERRSLKTMQNRLPLYLWLSSRATTPSYSTMIKPSKPMLGMFGTSSSLTNLSLRISTFTGSTHLGRDSRTQALGSHLIATQR